MIIADWYELAAIFDEEDFVQGAAVFFQYLQYTEQGRVMSCSIDVDRWVYHVLGYDIYLSKEELAAIKQIKLAGEMSSVCISDTEKIRLFAIELQPWASRSQVAYTIHKLFAKGLGSYSTILFSQEKEENRECLLAIDVGDSIILSDWFSAESDVAPLLAINGSYLSSLSAKDFQLDLSYEIGRSYYRTPDTPATIRYELLQYNSCAYVLADGGYNWQQLHDDVEELYIGPLRTYGDDYIEPPSKEIKDDEDISIDDIFTSFENDEDDDNEIIKIEEDLAEKKEKDEIDRLLEDLGEDFDDPVKLLKALDIRNELRQDSIKNSVPAESRVIPTVPTKEASQVDEPEITEKVETEVKENIPVFVKREINNGENVLWDLENGLQDNEKTKEEIERIEKEKSEKEEIVKRLVQIQKEISELQQKQMEKETELKSISVKEKESRILSGLTKRLRKWSKNPWQRKMAMQPNRMVGDVSRLKQEIDNIVAQERTLSAEAAQCQKELDDFSLIKK